MDRALLTAIVTAGLLAGAAQAQSPSPAASPSAAASPAVAGREVSIAPADVNSIGGKPAAEEVGEPNPALKDQKTKASYAFGYKFGGELSRVIEQLGMEVDMDTLVMGIKDVVGGKKPSLSMKEMEESVKAHITESRKNLGEKNKKDGEKFQAENKAKKGVTTLPSGLQYEVLKEGTGKKPAATDTVSTNYRGTLINGTEFDSSYKRGEPTTFPVNGVIPGWSEALQKMTVGSKWKLVVPSDLAYGAQGAPPKIGPNSTLVFEVELLEIKGGGKEAPKDEAGGKPELKIEGSAAPEASPAASPSPEASASPEAK